MPNPDDAFGPDDVDEVYDPFDFEALHGRERLDIARRQLDSMVALARCCCNTGPDIEGPDETCPFHGRWPVDTEEGRHVVAREWLEARLRDSLATYHDLVRVTPVDGTVLSPYEGEQRAGAGSLDVTLHRDYGSAMAGCDGSVSFEIAGMVSRPMYGVNPETIIGRALGDRTRLRLTAQVIADERPPRDDVCNNPWHSGPGNPPCRRRRRAAFEAEAKPL